MSSRISRCVGSFLTPAYSYCSNLSFILVITVLAWRLSGSEISDYGDNVMDALLLAPTIFPILYAAIVGKFMRSCALQYAERGATLGVSTPIYIPTHRTHWV